MATIRELVTEWGFDIDDKPLRKMDSGIKGIKSTLTTLGVAVAGVGALVGGVFLRQAGIYEQANIAFETMLGSAEKAKVLLKEVTDFAAKTPFDLPGLIESSKRLLAFGFAQEKIIPTMQSLGNIAAGVGKEKLPQLILALGQVRAATKLRGQELRQFTEAGVPLIEEIAKMKNIAEKEVQDLVSKGEVSFTDTNKALQNLTSGSGRFANLMIKQSASLFGIISNLKDNFTVLSIEIGQELLPEAKRIANTILNWVDANKELLKTKALIFVKALTKMAKQLFFVLEGVFAILKSVTLAFGGIEKTLLTVIKVFGMFLALKLAFHVGTLVQGIVMVTAAIFKLGNVAALAQIKLFAIPIAIGLAIAAIGLLVEDIVAFFQGKDSITGRLIDQMKKNFPEAVSFIKGLFGFWKAQIMLIVKASKFIWTWMIKLGGVAANVLRPIMSALKNSAMVIGSLFGLWKEQVLLVVDIFKLIWSWMMRIAEIANDVLKPVMDALKESSLVIKDIFIAWKDQVMLVVSVFKLIWTWMMKIALVATNILQPVMDALKNSAMAIFKVFSAAGNMMGLDFGKAIQKAIGVAKGAVNALGQGNIADKLQQARAGASGARSFIQGITPATTPSPRVGEQKVNNNSVTISPVINNEINGSADPVETANQVNQTVNGNIEKLFREAGRDLTPAIER